MPRFFFNVRHRPGPAGLAVDPEGDELADVTAAREHALFEARIMIARDRHTMVITHPLINFERPIASVSWRAYQISRS